MTLLATAMSSVVSELKMYSVFDTMAGESGRPRSTAAGFDERLRSLFPEVAADAGGGGRAGGRDDDAAPRAAARRGRAS